MGKKDYTRWGATSLKWVSKPKKTKKVKRG